MMKLISPIKINNEKTACILMLLLFATFMPGCYHDKEEILYPGSNTAADCSTLPAKFATDIYPLVTTKCAIPGCHDATASGGVVLQNYSLINAKKDRINTRALIERSMPPTGPLSPEEINKIKCWIDGGALNN